MGIISISRSCARWGILADISVGITPGAVSLFAVFNDTGHAVEVVVDKTLWDAPAFQFHPLVNSSTLVITKDHLERFLERTGHPVRVIDVPARQEA